MIGSSILEYSNSGIFAFFTTISAPLPFLDLVLPLALVVEGYQFYHQLNISLRKVKNTECVNCPFCNNDLL